MYQGRHCTYQDYDLFKKISEDFYLIINRDNFELNEVDNYLDTFSDFDNVVALKIRINLEKMASDKPLAIRKIKALLGELENNILVDIREHN